MKLLTSISIAQLIPIVITPILTQYFSPEDFGLAHYSLDEIKGGTPKENANIVKAILAGHGADAHNAAVIINCAALLYLHDKAENFKAAAQLASEVLASGSALNTLKQLVALSNEENLDGVSK